MAEPSDLNRRRDIVFSSDPAGQVERAYKLLSALPKCRVERSGSVNTLKVSYNLQDYTLEGLENALSEEGFRLDDGMLHNIARKIIYYCEDTVCHNLDIPTYLTKKNERKVFVNAYDQEPHGDYDVTPPELRDYK